MIIKSNLFTKLIQTRGKEEPPVVHCILAKQAKARVVAHQTCAEQAKTKAVAARAEQTKVKATDAYVTCARNHEPAYDDTVIKACALNCRAKAFSDWAEQAEAETEAFRTWSEEAKPKLRPSSRAPRKSTPA